MENKGDVNYDEALNKYTPLALAYLGDAVFELHIRNKILINNMNLKPKKLHELTREFVKAQAQAQIYHILIPYLNEEEMDVMKRGRNAKPPSSGKNSSISDYRHATGVETLFGYLYVLEEISLNNEFSRIRELIDICYNSINKE